MYLFRHHFRDFRSHGVFISPKKHFNGAYKYRHWGWQTAGQKNTKEEDHEHSIFFGHQHAFFFREQQDQNHRGFFSFLFSFDMSSSPLSALRVCRSFHYCFCFKEYILWTPRIGKTGVLFFPSLFLFLFFPPENYHRAEATLV